jgi:hypothetical protein
MKKEVGIAIVFGLIVGLIITIGMYRARTALQTPLEGTPDPFAQDITTESPLPANDIVPENSSQLRVTSPLDEELRTSKDILISGITFPNSTIVILHNEHEVMSSSDVQGNFSVPDVLEAGANVFRIRVLAPDQSPIEVLRTVVFESNQPESTASPSAAKKTNL